MCLRTTIVLPMALAFMKGSALADQVIDVQGREVRIGASTQIIVDGEVLPPGSSVPDTLGVRVEARFAAGGTRGAAGEPAITVIFSYPLKGPVTSTSPLRVIGQEVTVTADTVTEGVIGGIETIEVGDHLGTSGYIDTNSSLLASFVEYVPEPLARWRLSGYVTAITGDIASFGPQQVDIAGIEATDCGGSLAVGQFVELRADRIPVFDADTVIDTVTDLRCVAPVPIGTPGSLGVLYGLVGNVVTDSGFDFGPYNVTIDANTEYRFGSIGDLAPGVALELDGVFGENLGFVAQEIAFGAPQLRLQGPVDPEDIVAGANGSALVLANLVHRSGQVRDEDGIMANGIAQARQIEIRGYVDSQGDRYMTRIRDRGAPDLTDSRAAGEVDAVARPILDVLGLILDTTGALFEDGAENPISEDEFFAGAVPGAQVEQSGAWDADALTLTGGVVALLAPAEPPPVRGTAVPAELIVGTLRSVDRIFTSGFE